MFQKIQDHFRKRPNLYVAAGSLLAGTAVMFPGAWLVVYGGKDGADLSSALLVGTLIGAFLFYPAALTFWNLWQLCRLRYQMEALDTARITDAVTILWGAVCVACYLMISDVRMEDWTETLVNSQVHTPIATWTIPTVAAIGTVAFVGYLILRLIPIRKLPPLFSVLAMSAMYMGIGLCVLFTVQLAGGEFLLAVYPFNLLLVFGKTVRQVCMQQEPDSGVDADQRLDAVASEGAAQCTL